jgi:dihydrofolate reductase
MNVSVYIALSVDGFIARKDHSLDWLDRVQRDGEDYGYAAFAATVDAVVMGRNTYETARGFESWPYPGKRVVVLTHRPIEGAPDGVEARDVDGPDEIAAFVAELAAAGVGRVYVDGGTVIRAFLAAGVVDDVTLSIIPVLLGEGVPLFGGVPEIDLELASSSTFPSGLVQLRYRTAR